MSKVIEELKKGNRTLELKCQEMEEDNKKLRGVIREQDKEIYKLREEIINLKYKLDKMKSDPIGMKMNPGVYQLINTFMNVADSVSPSALKIINDSIKTDE